MKPLDLDNPKITAKEIFKEAMQDGTIRQKIRERRFGLNNLYIGEKPGGVLRIIAVVGQTAMDSSQFNINKLRKRNSQAIHFDLCPNQTLQRGIFKISKVGFFGRDFDDLPGFLPHYSIHPENFETGTINLINRILHIFPLFLNNVHIHIDKERYSFLLPELRSIGRTLAYSKLKYVGLSKEDIAEMKLVDDHYIRNRARMGYSHLITSKRPRIDVTGMPLAEIVQWALRNEAVWQQLRQNKIQLDCWKWRIEKHCYIMLRREHEVVKIHVRTERLFKWCRNPLDRILRVIPIEFEETVPYGGAHDNDRHLEMIISEPFEKATNMELLETLTHHLSPLFEVKDYTLNFKPKSSEVGLVDCFIFNITRQFRSIKYKQEHVTYREMEECRFLQIGVTVENLRIDLPNLDDTHFTEPLTQENVILRNSSFIRLSSFLSMECQHLKIERDNVNGRDLNILLWNWIGGGMPYLRSLSVNLTGNNDIDGADTMYNIISHSTRRELPVETEKYNGEVVWNAIPVEIVRATDGRKGMVLIDGTRFRFWVMPSESRSNPIFLEF